MTERERNILRARIADLREVRTTLAVRMESADKEIAELEALLAATPG